MEAHFSAWTHERTQALELRNTSIMFFFQKKWWLNVIEYRGDGITHYAYAPTDSTRSRKEEHENNQEILLLLILFSPIK